MDAAATQGKTDSRSRSRKAVAARKKAKEDVRRPEKADRKRPTKGVIEEKIELLDKEAFCPKCGNLAKKHSVSARRIWHLSTENKPKCFVVVHAKYNCKYCPRIFSADMTKYAPDNKHFSHAVINTAKDMAKQGMTLRQIASEMKTKHHVYAPKSTVYDWISDDYTMRLKQYRK